MSQKITLQNGLDIIDICRKEAKNMGLKPLSIVILDARAVVIIGVNEDNSSLMRFDIAKAKAYSTLTMNRSTRKIGELASDRPEFFGALSELGKGIIPVAGGILIRAQNGEIIGAIGVSGDSSDNDEALAIKAIETLGFKTDKD